MLKDVKAFNVIRSITQNIIDIVSELHPNKFKFNEDNFFDKLYGSDELRSFILSDK